MECVTTHGNIPMSGNIWAISCNAENLMTQWGSNNILMRYARALDEAKWTTVIWVSFIHADHGKIVDTQNAYQTYALSHPTKYIISKHTWMSSMHNKYDMIKQNEPKDLIFVPSTHNHMTETTLLLWCTDRPTLLVLSMQAKIPHFKLK